VVTLLVAACSKEASDDIAQAQARVDAAEQGVNDANSALQDARVAFCGDAKNYIQAIDRYGKLFTDDAATVGDVQTLGADLAEPKASTEAAAQAVVAARDALTAARQELLDAQAALKAAQASASGKPAPTKTKTAQEPETKVEQASIDRVRQAEQDLERAARGITDETPVAEAGERYNSAAFALEVAWLNLFADAECFDDEQQQQAAEAVHDYTAALQANLKTAGYYDEKVDGVYGPGTVAAVEELQKDSALPVTGLVDQATSVALDAAVEAAGGAAAANASTQATAVQTTLKLAGYWDGPIDGNWTPELTDALKKFQTDLGVEPTGAVDAATLAALEEFLGTLTTPPPPTTAPETTEATTPPTTPATTAPTTPATTGPTTTS